MGCASWHSPRPSRRQQRVRRRRRRRRRRRLVSWLLCRRADLTLLSPTIASWLLAGHALSWWRRWRLCRPGATKPRRIYAADGWFYWRQRCCCYCCRASRVADEHAAEKHERATVDAGARWDLMRWRGYCSCSNNCQTEMFLSHLTNTVASNLPSSLVAFATGVRNVYGALSAALCQPATVDIATVNGLRRSCGRKVSK